MLDGFGVGERVYGAVTKPLLLFLRSEQSPKIETTWEIQTKISPSRVAAKGLAEKKRKRKRVRGNDDAIPK